LLCWTDGFILMTSVKEETMTIRIEHANMIVRDVDATARFLQTAFPEFRIRREGNGGRRWLHIGTDDTYVALNEASSEPAERWQPYSGKPGLNHYEGSRLQGFDRGQQAPVSKARLLQRPRR
jgi:hypothetical protein